MNSDLLQMGNCVEKVIDVGAAAAGGPEDHSCLAIQIQPKAELPVFRIGNETAGLNPALCRLQTAVSGFVDTGDHLAFPQRNKRLTCTVAGNAKCHAVARPAGRQTQDQAGIFRRSAISVGIDAKPPVQSEKLGVPLLDEVKIGSPHQRTITEHPKISLRGQWKILSGVPPFKIGLETRYLKHRTDLASVRAVEKGA